MVLSDDRLRSRQNGEGVNDSALGKPHADSRDFGRRRSDRDHEDDKDRRQRGVDNGKRYRTEDHREGAAKRRKGDEDRREHDKERERDRMRRDRLTDRDRERDRDRYVSTDGRDKDRAVAGRRRHEDRASDHRESNRSDRAHRSHGESQARDASRLKSHEQPHHKDKRNSEKEDGEEGEIADLKQVNGSNRTDGPSSPGSKAMPKSLEEVLQRRKELEEEAAKPKFLSRKEREQLALERNRKRAEAVRGQVDEARAQLRNAPPTNPAAGHAAQRHEEHLTAKEAKEREKDLEVIRQQYLGQQRQKRRIAKASDKFRFNFDWDAKEDTYEERLHDGGVLFGRGNLAGIDMRTQREAAALKEQRLLSDMRRARGDRTTAAHVQADIARATRASRIDEDPILKDAHWTDKAREEMTSRDWRIFNEDHRISCKNAGQNAPMPYRAWDEMPLPDSLRGAINDMKYAKPSPIQMASIPFGLRQRDVIGLAETGSGKTAAFVLPMLRYIMDQPEMTDAVAAEGPYALVLAPTRELAQQIEEEIVQLAKYTKFRTACIVGGASYEVQKGKLRKGAEIVVATPGRLLDCLEKRYAVLNQCAYIVLDEADEMINLGFEPQVMDVLAAMPASNMRPMDEDEAGTSRAATNYRTTYMFSATMPPAVERIAKRYLRRPVTVTVGSTGRATDNVTQRVEWMDKKQKAIALLRALDTFQADMGHTTSSDNDGFKIIVFVNNRENSEDVYSAIAKAAKYNVGLLHGGKSQEQREEMMKGFREGDYDIMIATDVAGRGIDVRDIGLVINYDMPHTIEKYTHRIGRTGRAGRRGTAVTFLTASDEKTFYDLKTLLEGSKAHVPHQLANHEAAKHKPGQFEQSKKDTTLYAT